MASVIETHPQRQKIIDAILAGRTVRDIAASVSPKLSPAAVQRYRMSKVTPALRNAVTVTKILNGTDLNAPISPTSPELGKAVSETRAALAADPFISRVEQLRADREKVKALAIEGEHPDLRAWATLDRNDLTELELHAKLTGRLADAAGPSVAIQIVCPAGTQPQVVADDDGAVVVDLGAK